MVTSTFLRQVLIPLALLATVGRVWADEGSVGGGQGSSRATIASATHIVTTPPFDVRDVTGPAKDRAKTCYVCAYNGRPSIVVFTRTLTGSFPQLANSIDQFVAENREHRAAAFVVYLADNSHANRRALSHFASHHHLSIPLVIPLDGPRGPSAYRLGNDFETLVLITNHNRVNAAIPLTSVSHAGDIQTCEAMDDILAAAGKNLGSGQ